MEENLNTWFLERRTLGFPVSGDDIKGQAGREFRQWWAELPDATKTERQEQRPLRYLFHASKHWLENFMER